MEFNRKLAKHIKEVHFGGNWTSVNLKEVLGDVSWKQATTQLGDVNTIVALTFHIGYFFEVVINALKTHELVGNDSLSFVHPPINNQEDWETMRRKLYSNADELSDLLHQLSENIMEQVFFNEKYGSYFRNIMGLIEHTHYHMGQIVIIKKMLKGAA